MRDELGEVPAAADSGGREIRRIACVGAGVIGHSWATFFAMKGYPVWLHDLSEAILRRSLGWIQTALALCAEKGVLADREVAAAVSRVQVTTDLSAAVTAADLVVEAVFEDYAVKRQVFQAVDGVAPADAILASSSSYLLMSKIQSVTRRPGRCIEVHPFNPPHLIPLVEVVPGRATEEATVARTVEFFAGVGKVPVVVRKELGGYIANRLQRALSREAVDLVESGVASVEDVDLAVSAGPGLRWALYGPFLVNYFNTPSHLSRGRPQAGPVADGYAADRRVQEQTFDAMVRWRDSRLIDLLRVVGYLPPSQEGASSS